MLCYLYLIVVLYTLLLSSCDGRVEGNGRIISAKNGKPLDSVLIYWINVNDTSFSDIEGRFNVGGPMGCVGKCPDMELIFSKKGYRSKYIHMKSYQSSSENLTVQMTPSIKDLPVGKRPFSLPLQVLNILISIFNVFTIVYIVCNRVKYRWLWMIAIMISSLLVPYNYFTGEFGEPEFRFMINYADQLSWYTYFIPTVPILYWGMYSNISFLKKTRSGAQQD